MKKLLILCLILLGCSKNSPNTKEVYQDQRTYGCLMGALYLRDRGLLTQEITGPYGLKIREEFGEFCETVGNDL